VPGAESLAQLRTFAWRKMKVEMAEVIAGIVDVLADAPLKGNPLAVKKGMHQLRSKFQSQPLMDFPFTKLGNGEGSAVQVAGNPLLCQSMCQKRGS